MTQHTLPEVHLLNSSGLLKYLLDQPLLDAIDPKEVQYWVFLSYHKANRFQPDHIMDAKWRGLNQYREDQQLILGPILTLKRLASEYFEGHRECRVKLDRFSYWQTMMARISSLPLQAVHVAEDNPFAGHYVPEYRWPAYPYHPYVEDYIHREQLHETHQHLNGSSTTESCWLMALERPDQTCKIFHKEYYNPKGSEKLKQLCAQIDPQLTPVTLLERLPVFHHTN
ncbi:hypothetical protein [Endozoicomonas atrinae]|uniref:hypothetical protein n=1 Tax=Endozoicomonas atrinae TaxID=1333660 RepID=UPI003AFF969F